MWASQFVPSNWPWLLAISIAAFTTYHIIKFINHRRFYKNLPTPPHSLLLGNLKIMGDTMKLYPPDIHPQPLFTNLAAEHNLHSHGLYYMDLHPFSQPLIFILDPALALQIQSQPNVYPRHPYSISFLGGLVGTKSIFSTMGAEWHQQRSWFAPAFAMSHLLTLVPGMINEVLIFKEKLTSHAVKGEVFRMNEEAGKLAIDLIGRNVGDIKLGSQTGGSEIQHAFEKGVGWVSGGLTGSLWNKLVSPIMSWWWCRKLDRCLGEVIGEKYKAERKDDGVDKSILDLALRGYSKQKGKVRGEKISRPDQDEEFMKIALDNAKTFFVGGHDTTASTITYALYYLSISPDILARVREEHDQVFGTTLESTIASLKSNSALVNNLPLTLAVIKEVLRIHPIGFTVRSALPGTTLTHNGNTYPMSNHMICVLTSSIHRNASTFPSPTTFLPDRWLPTSPEYVGEAGAAAWQPFEKGPRNCIGQQLALLEIKIVMVLVCRWFDFEAKLEEAEGSVEGWGGKAYQELKLSAKPKGGLPMVAKLRD